MFVANETNQTHRYEELKKNLSVPVRKEFILYRWLKFLWNMVLALVFLSWCLWLLITVCKRLWPCLCLDILELAYMSVLVCFNSRLFIYNSELFSQTLKASCGAERDKGVIDVDFFLFLCSTVWHYWLNSALMVVRWSWTFHWHG